VSSVRAIRPPPDGPPSSSAAESIIEAANDAYLATDEAGGIVAWNAQAEHTFGWSRVEALGRSLGDTIIAPSSRPTPEASFARILSAARGPVSGRRIELEAVHRDGHGLPVEASLWTTHSDGTTNLHAFLHDISARRHQQETLYRMATLVYSLDEAVLGLGPDGTILSWNSGAERTFGYAAAEVVGSPASMLLPPEHQHEVSRWWEALRAREGVQCHEIEGVRKNGVIMNLVVTISPFRDGREEVSGASVIARDVTQQHWMAKTLENTLESLESALQETRESEARSRRFLGDAAHQLRTPIAGIRASAETLLRGSSPADRDRLLLNVVRETSRASRVMTGLLRMARVDQGETLRYLPCDVVGLCAEEVERACSLAPDLEISVQSSTEPSYRPELDPNVVREILTNLLDNARRHARRCIEVTVTRADDLVEIRVLDDGPGLSDNQVERAFERFVSLDGKGGSGLGLTIAKRLAQAHDGDLSYERGFVLRLPGTAPKIDCGGAARPGPLPT